MKSEFVPFAASALLAQELSDHPERLKYRLLEFSTRLNAHHDQIGLTDHDPRKARFRLLQHQLRIAGAPLYFAVIKELTANIRSAQKRGEPLVLPEYQSLTSFDRRITNDGERQYSDEHLNFLRALGALSYTAATEVIKRIHIEKKEPKLSPFWDLYYDVDTMVMGMGEKLNYRPRRVATPRERFLDHLAAAGTTALRIMLPAAQHGILDKTKELSWAASTSVGFYDSYFPEPGAPRSRLCPFDHNSDAIWSVPTLRDGPWRTPLRCPVNVPYKYGSLVTGAQLWIEAATVVAREMKVV